MHIEIQTIPKLQNEISLLFSYNLYSTEYRLHAKLFLSFVSFD